MGIEGAPIADQDDLESVPTADLDDLESAPIANQDDLESAPTADQDDLESAPIADQDDLKSAPLADQDGLESAPIAVQDDLESAPMTDQEVLVFPISPASLEASLTNLLTSNGKGFEYVLKIWYPIKKLINVEHFSCLLNDLCSSLYLCRNQASFDHEELTHVSQTILCVWTSISDELKMQYFHGNDYVDKLFLRLKNAIGTEITDTYWQPRVCYKHDISFFWELFSDMPSEMRPKIWREYWLLLVFRSRGETLRNLINLCLVDPDEKATFIIDEMLDFTKMETIVESWSNRRFLFEVIDYSNLICSWNSRYAREFRRRVFSIIIPALEDYDSDKLLEVCALILSRSIFTEPTDRSYDYKDVRNLLVNKLERGFSEVVFWVMERFTPTKRKSLEVQFFSTYWHDFLTIEQSDQDYAARWKEFSLWWECEENDFPLMKQFLSVDEIFPKLLRRVIQKLTECLGALEMSRAEPIPSRSIKIEEFELVDSFLTWYFDTEKAATKYKKTTLFDFKNIPWLATLLDANNECVVNDLLKWFLNGDLYEMTAFKNNEIKKTYGRPKSPVHSHEPSESPNRNEDEETTNSSDSSDSEIDIDSSTWVIV